MTDWEKAAIEAHREMTFQRERADRYAARASVPDRLSKMPLSAPIWAWLAYLAGVIFFGWATGSANGFMLVMFATMFSFQFWVFACWRGLRRQESKVND